MIMMLYEQGAVTEQCCKRIPVEVAALQRSREVVHCGNRQRLFDLFNTPARNENEVIYPAEDKCSRKLTMIYGPSGDEQRMAKNTWLAEGLPGSYLKIDFFTCRGVRSINWMPSTPSLAH